MKVEVELDADEQEMHVEVVGVEFENEVGGWRASARSENMWAVTRVSCCKDGVRVMAAVVRWRVMRSVQGEN